MATSVSREPHYDVIIVGGGVIGCSTAYHLLLADRSLRVAVVERDPTYRRASSALSIGNARVQFTLAENIEVSKYTFEVLGRFAEDMEVDGEQPDIAFKPEGNLFLHDDQTAELARQALDLQHRLGCRVAWQSPSEIEARFPMLALGGLLGGTFSADDGHLDGYAFLMGYRRRAISLGAVFLADEVTRIELASGAVTGVGLAESRNLAGPVVVNCAGAWAADLVRTAGIELPIDPVQRQVFVVEPEEKPASPLPLTNLPSGLYFRSEGDDRILVGQSLTSDRVGYHFDWQEGRFNDLLWPQLVEVVPAFDRLRFERGWTGLYAVNTLDGNAILGHWPEVEGLFLANGFSGHGLQQAPAVGRYLSELIVGRQPLLDLSALGPERILTGVRVTEAGLV